MISLDQVFLLEQKVESAVAKIQQLQAENDALRTKCDQLTNALSAKSEQLSSFENDQTQIEDGIKKALDRLNSIENSVLKAASKMNSNVQVSSPVQTQQIVQPQVIKTQPVNNVQNTNNVQSEHSFFSQSESHEIIEETSPSFETMQPTESVVTQNSQVDFGFNNISFEESPSEDQFEENPTEEDSTDGLGFDIF